MTILVADTSVLVDLDRAGLLEAAFSSQLTMVVPDLLYEKELAQFNGPYLQQLGLSVVALTASEMTLAQAVRRERNSLSLPDCFALACAHRENHALVSGDKALRSEAIKRLGAVYGLLWMLDRLAESGKVEMQQLIEGLCKVQSHPRCRLPKEEVDARLARWKLFK
jgi:hypothetical protein